MFSCPVCNQPIPKRNAFLLTNFTTVTCTGCKTKLKPNRATMEKVGGMGVAVALPVVLIINKIFGIVATLSCVVLMYIVISLITMKVVTFDKSEKTGKK